MGSGVVVGFVMLSVISMLDVFYSSSRISSPILSQILSDFAPLFGITSLIVGGIIGALPVQRDNVVSLALIALIGMLFCSCPMAAFTSLGYQTAGPGGVDPFYAPGNLTGIMFLIVISMVLGGKLGKTIVMKVGQ